MYPLLSQLAVRVRPLDLGDSLGKASELIRSSGGRAAPVMLNGHVLGMLTGADLAQALATDPEKAKDVPVAALTLQPAYGVPDFWTADRAMVHFRRDGLEHSPVSDAGGRYLGMVSVPDLATALCGRLKPKSIGGMATPFGVYLTDGSVRGGVGDWALASAGVYIGLLHLAALALTYVLFGPEGWIAWLPSARDALEGLGGEQVRAMIAIVLFAVAFRLSHVAGYHAAEHQVVHAIEAGDDLRTEVVRQKPRAHPRCGTNLVVGLLLIVNLWGWKRLQDWGELGAIAAVALVVFAWRRLGSVAQQYVTTLLATDRQIASGIRAGEQLLEEFQLCRPRPPSRWLRIWNMGICQVFAGFLALLVVASILDYLVDLPGYSLF